MPFMYNLFEATERGLKNNDKNQNRTDRDRPSARHNICNEGLRETGRNKTKLKMAPDILLFQERSISIGKATEL